jgi:hypothetical protein
VRLDEVNRQVAISLEQLETTMSLSHGYQWVGARLVRGMSLSDPIRPMASRATFSA